LLLNTTLAPRLVESGVDRWVRSLEKPSDHAPAWVKLDLGAKPRATKGPSRVARRTRG
jgi:exodeoxyribonuclease-3